MSGLCICVFLLETRVGKVLFLCRCFAVVDVGWFDYGLVLGLLFVEVVRCLRFDLDWIGLWFCL